MALFYSRTYLAFFALRVISVFLHYMGPSPWGGPLILSPDRFIPEALVIESALLGLIVFTAALGEPLVIGAAPKKHHNFQNLYRLMFLALVSLYATFAQIDFEVTRWLGQHMSASYIANFMGARDGHLFARILAADILFSSLALIQIILALVTGPWLWLSWGRASPQNKNQQNSLTRKQFVITCCFLAVSLASPFWLRPSDKRWRRIEPASLGIPLEVATNLMGAGQPKDPKRAEQDLIDFIYAGKFDANTKVSHPHYPLYRSDNLGKISPEDYRSLEPAKKADVILIVFETMRGANTGFLGDANDPLSAMPLLREEIQKNARYFPRMHSNGYPSVAGAMSMHLGVWPHHSRIVFSSYLHINSLAFPEMLQHAGYQTSALLGADPSFSNFTPWFRRWYQDVEYDPENHHDGPLVTRFLELYEQKKSSSDPLFLTLWTATTHPPYDVPKESGVTPSDTNEKRYLQAMRYADKHIHRLISHLKMSPRWDRTLVFLLGDHGQPTPYQWLNPDEIGELTPGHTWTSLAILGGSPHAPSPARDERVISHVDLAPTILSALNLRHDNHFFGRNLLKDQQDRPVLSFRYGAMSLESGARRTVFRVDGNSSLTYEFDSADVRSYGALQGGKRVTKESQLDLSRYQDMAKAWAQLLEENRLAPDMNISN